MPKLLFLNMLFLFLIGKIKRNFITFNDYVKENLTTGEKYNLHNINYCLSINAFFIEHLEDSMSTINERNHRKNPPYECCDKEVDYSDDDFMEIYD